MHEYIVVDYHTIIYLHKVFLSSTEKNRERRERHCTHLHLCCCWHGSTQINRTHLFYRSLVPPLVLGLGKIEWCGKEQRVSQISRQCIFSVILVLHRRSVVRRQLLLLAIVIIIFCHQHGPRT
jgi:hypothetical protein